MCRVFLSYGHDEHAALAGRLKHDLEAAGLPTWFDAERLKPGGDWERYIEEGLEWTAAEPGKGRLILLMTPHSVRRPDGYCLNELARAIDRELPVVPVMLATVEPPLSIARHQWLDMRPALAAGDAVYAGLLERLRRAVIERDLDFEAVQSRLVRRLRPLSFDAEIHAQLEQFTGRRWVGDLLDAWLADPAGDRLLWITGGPGAGKTALAARLTTQRPEIAAVHFCQHTNARKVDPRQAATSIAYQLTTQLTDYAQRVNGLAIDAVLDGTDAETLFDDLVVQPLVGTRPDDGRVRVVLVDALDEAPQLARLVASALPRLPDWLRFVVTSRPNEPDVAMHLQAFEPRRLEEMPENAADLKAYVAQALGGHVDPKRLRSVVGTVADRSENSFLYARWVALEVAAGRLDPLDPAAFPRGLGGIYAGYFERQFHDRAAYARRQRPVLEAMCAAKAPLPLDEVAEMLGWSDYDGPEILDSFGSLVTTRAGCLHAFHLSVLEWAGDRARSGPYWAAPAAGRRRLAAYGWAQYETRPDAMAPYALHHAAAHLVEAERADRAARLLLDFRVLRPRSQERADAIAADMRAAEAALDGERAALLARVRSVFELASRILVREPGQLASQLQARLLSRDEPEIRALVDQALAAADGSLVRALTPALRQAGDPLTRQFRGTFAGDDDPDLFALSAVALDETRDLALGAGEAGVVLVWSLSSGRLERRLAVCDEGFSCGALDRAGGRWVLGGWEGTVTVVDLDDVSVSSAGGEGAVNDLAISPDGSRVCSAHDFGFCIRELDGLRCSHRVEVGDGEVSAVAFTSDGLGLAVAVGSQVRVGPPAALQAGPAFDVDVAQLSYSPDGATLAVGCSDGTIRLVSAGPIRTLAGHPVFTYATTVNGLRFLGGGGRLASTGWDGALRVWDVETATEVGACQADSKVFSLAVDAAGRWAMTGLKSGGPRLWDLARLEDVPEVPRHRGGVGHLSVVSESGLAVTAGEELDGAGVRVWRLRDGELTRTIPATGYLHALATSSERLFVLDEAGISCATLTDDGEAELDAAVALDPQPEWPWSIAMAEGVVVALRVGYPGDDLLVWRGPAWRATRLAGLDTYSVVLALSADGAACAAAGGSGLYRFDLDTGRRAQIPLDDEGHGDVSALAVLHGASACVVGTERGTILLVDRERSGARVLRPASGDWITTLALSADERTLVAGTSGGRLELWSLERGAMTGLFCGSEAWTAVWASPGGERIVAGDGVGAVHFLRR